MSLADELLADLEDMDDDEKDMDTDMPYPSELSGNYIKQELFPVSSKTLTLDQVSKLMNSERLRFVLKEIETYSTSSRSPDDIQGPVEMDPEYQLIVESNNLAVEVDNDISAIHKYIRDLYSKRFSELESLVVNPLEYITTVKELGNDISRAKHSTVLQQILTQATVMVLSVTSSTTQG